MDGKHYAILENLADVYSEQILAIKDYGDIAIKKRTIASMLKNFVLEFFIEIDCLSLEEQIGASAK